MLSPEAYNLKPASSGFTLIEMLVSVALFAIVMVVCVGALLSLIGANRKAQAIQAVMNNLNISVDDMVRNARMGTNFSCGVTSVSSEFTSDCPSGGRYFAFTPFGDPNPQDPFTRWVYAVRTGGGCDNGAAECIAISKDGGRTYTSLTDPAVAIDNVQFFVVGSVESDGLQPHVIAVIKGTAYAQDEKASTSFHIEATAVQRALDI